MDYRCVGIMGASLLLAGSQALAWGAAGHMAVGTIADNLLAGTKAGTEVRKILGSNLRTAAVWADCAKGVNTTTFKYGGVGDFAECKIYEKELASQQQMEAFVRRNHDNCSSPHNPESCHKQYHYTDVAIQRAKYGKGYVGTSDQDVVAAIAAAIVVLQGGQSPPPFRIAGKREALRLLAHYVGDVHQPLHVAAVYVDAAGKVVDPDEGNFDANTETRGGNDLLIAATPTPKKLHGEWDNTYPAYPYDQPPAAVLKKARAVPLTPGPLAGWATAWATESLVLGAAAYQGIRYSPEDAAHRYTITLPPGYDANVRWPTQREQVVKAGARLAQIMRAIWPD